MIVNGTTGADKLTASSPTPGTALISGLATKVQVDKAEFTQDLVTVNGLGDNDTFNSDVTVTGPAAIVANGGEGTDTARYLGSAEGDEVFFAAVGTGVARVGTATTSGLDVSAGTEETLIQTLGANDVVSGQNGISDRVALHGRRRRGRGHPARRRRRRQADRRHRRRPDRRQPRQRHRRSAAAATTTSSGIRATATTSSTARATTTCSTSTAPTPARSSTCSPTAARRA